MKPPPAQGHPCNAGQLLIERFASHGGRPALLADDRQWTYRELASLSDQAGNALRSHGIGVGDRVLMALEDCAELVALMVGGLKIGAVVVAVSPRTTEVELSFFIEDTRCRAIIASEGAALRAQRAAASRPWVRLGVANPGDRRRETVLSFIRTGDSRLEAAPTTTLDAAIWQYTSGSTGIPKAAVHTHGGIAALADYDRERLQMSGADVVMAVGKLFTSMGEFMLMNALHAGATYCLLEGPPSPLTMASAIQRFRASLYCGLPSSYAGMLALPLTDFRSLRACVVGGERLSPKLAQAWSSRTGVELVNALASTEIGGPAMLSRAGTGDPARFELVPGFDAQVVGGDGDVPAPGVPGELLVKGPTTFARYANNEALSQSVVVDGWIHTGDQCVHNADGTFEYTGRLNDMLRLGGHWVDPARVESVLNGHPAVAESAVVARSDPNGVLVATAFVVLRPRHGPDPTRDLRDYVASRLEPHEVPRAITVVESLPKTPAGKIRRFMLATGDSASSMVR